MIVTPSLRLLPCTLAHYAAMLANDAPALAELLGAPVAADWDDFDHLREALPYAAEALRQHPESAAWRTYLFLDQSDGALIGAGGFHSEPTAEGTVEIGYSVAPSRQGRGLATEAARGLVGFAWDHPAVRTIVAHTLPLANASTRILEKVGFARHSIVDDPDVGPVWEWHLPRPLADVPTSTVVTFS